MQYKIMFFVPVFESIECVEDMIQNIHHVAPNSGILFHVNSSSSDEYFKKVNNLIKYYDFCYLLPKRYNSFWCSGYLFNIYIEMMDWCYQKQICDYVFLTHSNSLLINKQLETNIYQYQLCLYVPGPITPDCSFIKHVDKDEKLQRYVNSGDGIIYVVTTDGSTMALDVVPEFINELTPYLMSDPVNYPAEEYYIPTCFMRLKLKDKYNCLDSNLERWGDTKDNNINYYQLESEECSEYIIEMVLSKQENTLSKLNLYSLKKIKRDFHDKNRTILRNHFGYNNILYHAIPPS